MATAAGWRMDCRRREWRLGRFVCVVVQAAGVDGMDKVVAGDVWEAETTF